MTRMITVHRADNDVLVEVMAPGPKGVDTVTSSTVVHAEQEIDFPVRKGGYLVIKELDTQTTPIADGDKASA